LILEAINKYNTSLGQGDRGERGVPVPEVYALCMDKDVVGAGFYVMEFLEGRVFQNIFMKEVNDEDRRAWYVSSSSSVLPWKWAMEKKVG
jgi:hypothetical protein